MSSYKEVCSGGVCVCVRPLYSCVWPRVHVDLHSLIVVCVRLVEQLHELVLALAR